MLFDDLFGDIQPKPGSTVALCGEKRIENSRQVFSFNAGSRVGNDDAYLLTFNMPAAPGTYDFRFFANNVFTRLAISPPVSVQ